MKKIQVFVKAPRTRNTKAICFKMEGNIPEFVLMFLRSAFESVEVKNDDELEKWNETDLHKEIRSKMTPAGNLKMLRTTFGMTQKELAQKAGICTQQISDMERGKSPIGRKMAHLLAKALGTSYSNLFW